jgi:uncharacterized protein
MTRTPQQGRPVALVTGTTSGIGRAFARSLARDGVDVILVARQREPLESLAAQLRQITDATIEVLVADLVRVDELARVERCLEQRAISLLVNNAALGGMTPFAESPRSMFADMVAVNVTALMRLTHAAVPCMIKRGGGTIINVSSGAAHGLIPPLSVYGGSKAFVAHFTELLHEEVGTKGIRLQCLVPGLTRTNLGNAQATGVFDRFPPEMIMTPESIVAASLASLSMGELHCVTLLHDPGRWEEAMHGMHEMGSLPLASEVAPRYRDAAPTTWQQELQKVSASILWSRPA